MKRMERDEMVMRKARFDAVDAWTIYYAQHIS